MLATPDEWALEERIVDLALRLEGAEGETLRSICAAIEWAACELAALRAKRYAESRPASKLRVFGDPPMVDTGAEIVPFAEFKLRQAKAAGDDDDVYIDPDVLAQLRDEEKKP